MHFEYQITPEEYTAAQILYYKMNQDRTRLRWIAYSFFTALLCIWVAWSERNFSWPHFLLVITGALWGYVGLSNLLPPFLKKHFSRGYKRSDLAGKKFQTDMSEEGFEVTEATCSWRVRWPGVRTKCEDQRVFLLCSYGSMFIFGKKYLTDEQQRELRRFAGLVPTAKGHNLP